MPALRDYVGTNCPHCTKDILQQAPSTNRMQPEEAAWCPSCHSKFSVEQLARVAKPGLLGRLFGGSRPSRG